MDKPYTVQTGRWPVSVSEQRAPFSTWISPNNFGDFHPNPLMSLLTGNGQIEYPCPSDVNGSTVSRIGGAIARRDTDYITCYESRYITGEEFPKTTRLGYPEIQTTGDLFIRRRRDFRRKNIAIRSIVSTETNPKETNARCYRYSNLLSKNIFP